MNYSSNRNINLNVYTENDVLVLEKAVKSAISAVMDAIYRVSDAKMTEYQRMVAEKDKEISRLEVKLQQTENEVKAFVSQRGLCDSLSGQDDICVNLGNNASDGRPYGENQMTNEQDVKMDFPSLGTRTTPSVSAQCEDGVSAASSIQLVLEEQISLPSERTTDLVSPASQVTSPVVKEEPSSVETVFIKWEMCEQSFGGRQEGKQGQGCCGQSPTKKSLGTRTPPSVSAQCEEGVSAASSIQLVLEEQISLSSERTTDLVSPASQVTSPVVKEEPSSVETVFIKWEMCEQSFGGHQEGKQGQGCRGQSPTKKRKLTNAERQRRYREKCHATPEGLRAYKEREHLSYLRKRVLISEMSEEIKRQKRAAWRAAARRARDRKSAQKGLTQPSHRSRWTPQRPASSPTTQRHPKEPLDIPEADPELTEGEDDHTFDVQYSPS